MRQGLMNFPLSMILMIGLGLPLRADSPKDNPSPATQSVPLGAFTLIKEELYFGLGLPNGKTLSQSQWQNFLDREITPRFPDGLTVVDAYGQYLNQKGKLSKERTKWVILLYKPRRDREQALQTLIHRYKQQFHQESVLRVTSTVQAQF